MRIAVVGSGRSVHALSRSMAIAGCGHEVRFVTVGDVPPAPGIEVRTRPLPRQAFAAAQAARSFVSDLRGWRPDLLHLHYAGGKLGTMAALSGIHPLVVTVMGGDVLPEQHPGGLSWLERRATRRILEQSDMLLVKSESLRSALEAWGGFAGKARVVRWGVDPARFRRDPAAATAMRTRLALSPRDRVILSPRPLAPLYNVDLAVEAMPRVLESAPDALLLVTEYNAEPSYRESLGRRAAALRLGDPCASWGRSPAPTCRRCIRWPRRSSACRRPTAFPSRSSRRWRAKRRRCWAASPATRRWSPTARARCSSIMPRPRSPPRSSAS